MIIHSNMKMADLVSLNFEILAVIQRLRIPFRFKDKTINTICKENNIDVEFFLQLAQWFHERDNFPQEELIQGHPELLITYLKNTHKYYLEYQVPRIDKEIELLEQMTGIPDQSAKLMIHFFKDYMKEFADHVGEEEEVTFPYIAALSKVIDGTTRHEEFKQRFGHYSIDQYLENHSDLEMKIFDLQSILLKHLPYPTDNCEFTNLLIEIYRLGKDLKDHTLLEENVLIPMVRRMEAELRAREPNF